MTEFAATMTFTIADMNPDAMALLFGAPPVRPTHSVDLTYVEHVPTLRPAPRKRRGLTGKRYRIARRAHARARRAWVRAGSPTVAMHRRIVIPRAHVEVR